MIVYANLNQQSWNSPLQTIQFLKKCKTEKDVKQIHSRMITTGRMKNRHLITRIILDLCSTPHSHLIEFARFLFFSTDAKIKEKEDPFLWNSVIKSFSHGPEPENTIGLFISMLCSGICVDRYTLSLVLKACSRLSLIKEGSQIHGILHKYGFGSDVFLQNSLIWMYSECGFVEICRHLFDKMHERDSVSWNSMIGVYIKNGKMNLARQIFDQMRDDQKNVITWNLMISGYSKTFYGIQIARALFDQMPNRDTVSWNSMINGYVKLGMLKDAYGLFIKTPSRDIVTWANMVDGYSKFGSIHRARCLFDRMPRKDVVAWNIMLSGYANLGHYEKAFDLFRKMRLERHLAPDSVTFSIILSVIAELGYKDEGRLVHEDIDKSNLSLDENLGVSLIHMYSNCGSLEEAARIFQDTRRKTVDHWNAMIGGLAVHGQGKLALALFFQMLRLCLHPNDITFIGLLSSCGHAGLVEEGLICFELMTKSHNITPKIQHYGCIIDLLGRAGYIEEALRIISNMSVKPNLVIWRALLAACKNNFNLEIGKEVAKQLFELDSQDPSSYILLSSLYAGVKLWDDSFRIRVEMNERKIQKVPGCSWIELDGIFHEFLVGDRSHPQSKEIYSMLNLMFVDLLL